MPATPILFCSHVVEMGGAEIVLTDLLAAIDRDRFAPHLACPGDGPLVARCEALAVPVHRVPFGRGGAWRKAASLPRAARELRAVAREHGCRLLIATSMIAGYTAVLAQHRELPCAWHVHIVTRSRIAGFALRRAHTVITPSRAGLVALPPRAATSDRVHVIPNGVAERFFAARPGGFRARLGVPNGAVLVGIVGRLDPQKGHEVLVDAFARVAAAHDAHLLVAGAELFANNQARVVGFGERLRARIEAAGLRDRVHLLGALDDTASLFAELDLTVVPSLAPESAPRAIAEAQAAGCAVVASRIGGTPELIADGATGLLTPPGDVDALARTLTQVLGDRTFRQQLAAAGRAFAAANYHMATFARRCERAFAHALGEPS